jgi:hypothetical protein
MTMIERLKGTGIALAILVLAVPVAVVITIVFAPLFRWFETQSGIESYGHSGPAQWCYLATYFAVVFVCAVIWSRGRRGKLTRQD